MNTRYHAYLDGTDAADAEWIVVASDTIDAERQVLALTACDTADELAIVYGGTALIICELS